jgi:hypothetical protein
MGTEAKVVTNTLIIQQGNSAVHRREVHRTPLASSRVVSGYKILFQFTADGVDEKGMLQNFGGETC